MKASCLGGYAETKMAQERRPLRGGPTSLGLDCRLAEVAWCTDVFPGSGHLKCSGNSPTRAWAQQSWAGALGCLLLWHPTVQSSTWVSFRLHFFMKARERDEEMHPPLPGMRGWSVARCWETECGSRSPAPPHPAWPGNPHCSRAVRKKAAC